MQKIVHQAFWDHIKEQLEGTPPKYEHALTLVMDIKEVHNTFSFLDYEKCFLKMRRNRKIQINIENSCMALINVFSLLTRWISRLSTTVIQGGWD